MIELTQELKIFAVFLISIALLIIGMSVIVKLFQTRFEWVAVPFAILLPIMIVLFIMHTV